MAGSRKMILAPVLLGVIGVPILLGLGKWQVERLAWKLGLIQEIELRMQAEPVPLPINPTSEQHRLLRVDVTGRLGSQELHALSAIKEHGPGYRIITPMQIEAQQGQAERTIMVDLGFVPERLKDPVNRPDRARPETGAAGDRVTGFLQWPVETDSYTPPPDLARNIWFARDVETMAQALNTDPVLIVAETHPLGEWPLPRPPGSGLRNNHLEYAITWFGLAVVWTIMSLIWFWAEWRKPSGGANEAT